MGLNRRLVALSVGIGIAAVPALAATSPALSLAAPARSGAAIEVKFRESAGVRLRGGFLTRLDGGSVAGAQAVLQRYWRRVERLFAAGETELDRERFELASRGKPTANLNDYLRVELVSDQPPDPVIADLTALPEVESAELAPKANPPPSTPDLTGYQGYRGRAPDGLDAEWASTYPSGSGAGVKIIDIEYSWNQNHEDLTTAADSSVYIKNGTPTDPFGNSHGTAVLGELIAVANGFGLTGIASSAGIGLVNVSNVERNYDLANSVYLASANLRAGDVILIEQQASRVDGQPYYIPVEWTRSVYDAIRNAVGQGITVVEAAGNGNENLDDSSLYVQPFPKGRTDTGAIIAGGGTAPCSTGVPVHSGNGVSTHGSRVTLQGWDQCVATTGWNGELFAGADENSYYTGSFNGTSAASPMVAAAAADVSAAYKRANGVAPDPLWVRNALISTGTPQPPSDTSGHIGPFPNLRKALRMTDWLAPTTVSFSASVTSSNQVAMNWSQSSDNVGVTAYKIFRNGQRLQKVKFPTTSYTDVTVTPHTTYSYYVAARDKAGNWSASSNVVTVRTR